MTPGDLFPHSLGEGRPHGGNHGISTSEPPHPVVTVGGAQPVPSWHSRNGTVLQKAGGAGLPWRPRGRAPILAGSLAGL